MKDLADDLVAPDAVRDPYAFFAALRREDPVHWSARHHAWILTQYADVKQALNDERLATSKVDDLQKRMSPEDLELFAPAADMLRAWMIFNDPPDHTYLRAPVRSAFTTRAVEGLRAQVTDLTATLLDDALAPGTPFDLLRTVAFTLPATAIALLLGVPTERAEDFKMWSRELGALVMGKVERSDAWERALHAAVKFDVLFSELIRTFELDPQDNLLSRLIAARDAGEHLDAGQMVGAATMILFGGHETTTNLIASGVLALLDHPDQLALLRARPELITGAVEEILRYDGPSKCFVRRAREDLVWSDGTVIRSGDLVFCAIAAANRDPAEFDDPDRFDIQRDPNRHLSFGWGMHFCLGAQLARLEAQVALAAILRRAPGLRLACDRADLAWQPTVVGRALRSLPVAVDGVASGRAADS